MVTLWIAIYKLKYKNQNYIDTNLISVRYRNVTPIELHAFSSFYAKIIIYYIHLSYNNKNTLL